MARLRTFSGHEVCRLLASQGLVEVRRRGSQAVMQRRTADSTVTVPVPLHGELRTGTLLAIIRQSGLPRNLFE